MRLLIALVATCLIAPVQVTPSAAQEEGAVDEFAIKAQELFEYEQGAWQSRWDWLDAEGQVTRSSEGTEVFSWYLDKSVVELTTEIPDSDSRSMALRFYNPVEKKIIFLSVDPKGDYWLMNQDPVTEVVQSAPHKSASGRETVIRFTTLRKAADEMDILMEHSQDNGLTWTKGFRQYMRRMKAE